MPRDALCNIAGQLQKKARSPSHNMGSALRPGHLGVCRVSAMMISLSFMFTFCNKNISSEHISTGLSMSSSWSGMYEKRTFGSFEANLFFNLFSESSVNCNIFCPGTNTSAKSPNAIILASVAGVTMFIIGRPCGIVLVNKLHMTCFVSVMNAALLDSSFFCSLFNVTRLSLYRSGENVSRQCKFLRMRDKQIPPTKLCSPVLENSDEQ